MIGFGFVPPCRTPRTQSERLSALVDGDSADKRLLEHVRGCPDCGRVLGELEAQRRTLGSWGDAPGAAPTDAGFHRLMATLSSEKRVPRLPWWFAMAASTALVVLVGGVATRQLLAQRERRATDEEIVAGADAAYRRAEREYSEALSLLRDRFRSQLATAPDPTVEAGARVLAAAREEAARLASQGRVDPERQALLREAFHAELRYYEDALLRGPTTTSSVSIEARP